MKDECPICHDGRMINRYQATPLDYSDTRTYPIYICSTCGYGKTKIGSQNISNLYEGGCYDVKEKAWHKFIRPLLSALEQGKLYYFKADKITGKKLLEIGCGKGRFLEAAKEYGFMVYGIEPSIRSFAFASGRLGNSVANVGLEELDGVLTFPSNFDRVMLWHVLEHLSDPGAVLSTIKLRLEVGGRAVIAVPNFKSLQARIGKSDWYHLDPPRHIHHFTPESLTLLAAENGFQVVNIQYNSFFQNYIGDIITIVNKFLPGKDVVFNGIRLNSFYFDRFGKLLAWGMFAFGMSMSFLLSPLVFVFTLFTQLAGLSGTMVVTMQQGDCIK